MTQKMSDTFAKSGCRGKTNLEMADQMFKDAFLIKKTRFRQLQPHLTDDELTKLTAEYFRQLSGDHR